MDRRLPWLLLPLVGLCGSAQAPDRIISGKAIDQTTNQGLPGITGLVKGRPTIRLNADRQLTDKLRVAVATTSARTLNRVLQGSNLSGLGAGPRPHQLQQAGRGLRREP